MMHITKTMYGTHDAFNAVDKAKFEMEVNFDSVEVTWEKKYRKTDEMGREMDVFDCILSLDVDPNDEDEKDFIQNAEREFNEKVSKYYFNQKDVNVCMSDIRYNVFSVLDAAIKSIRFRGFIKGDPEFDKNGKKRSTALHTLLILNNPSKPSFEGWDIISFSPASSIATEAYHWAMEKHDENSFFSNAAKVLDKGMIDKRYIKIVCAVANAYLQEMNGNKKSEFVGEIGEKISKKMKLVANRIDARYEEKNIYEMEDEDGNILRWTTSTTLKDLPESFVVSGKVKSHYERNGLKFTYLTRCKIEK